MVLTRNADHRPSYSTASTIRILRVTLDYKIRRQSDSLWIKSVYHGTESLSYLGPKSPLLFPAQLKNAESPEAFKYGIRRWSQKSTAADSVRHTFTRWVQQLRIQWRLSTVLKTSNKSVWSKRIYILEVYSVYVETKHKC